MAGNDSDIFVIITLWLLYIGIHVCMDFCERRARLQAELQAEAEGRDMRRGIFAEVMHGEGAGQQRRASSGGGGGRTRRSPRVVVIGAETTEAGSLTGEPCEGALVPDANGTLPQLPEPVLYGEASYAAREKERDEDAAVHVAVAGDEKDEKPTRMV